MNKMFKTLMASLIVLVLFVGCGSKTDNNGGSKPGADKTVNGSLTEIMEEVQKPLNLEIMVGTEPVDLTDADAVKYNLGLDSADGIKEAVISNAMISAQAYSVALVRTESDADAKKIAKAMAEGVDPMKWICALADDVETIVYGDTILLVMVDSQLEQGDAKAYLESFEAVAKGSADATFRP